jgi:Flp pilus assembly protein TadD
MANDPKKPVPQKVDPSETTPTATKTPLAVNSFEELYTPERVERWIKGEITMQELDGFSGQDIIEFAEIGHAQYENGRYDEARVIFTGLIALVPQEPYFRTALGCVFMAQENLERAEEMFSEAVGLKADDLSALVNRGEARLRQGKLEEAALDFKAVVDFDPKRKSPFTLRAQALAAAAVETLEAADGSSDNDIDEVSKSHGKPLLSPKQSAMKPKPPAPPKKK